jgi:hypothetical protein
MLFFASLLKGRPQLYSNKDLNTHRPTTNSSAQPLDGCPKTLEWDDALWSDNAYSGVVPTEDSTIRFASD